MAKINKNLKAKVGSSKADKRKNKQGGLASNYKGQKSDQSSKSIKNEKVLDPHAKVDNSINESDYEIVPPPR